MFKEIKIIEEHFVPSNKNNRTIIEIKNSNDIMGSEELNTLDKKFKTLVSKDTYNYDCREYPNVTVFITTYVFSTQLSSI